MERVYAMRPLANFTRLFLDQIWYIQARIALDTFKGILWPKKLKMDGFAEIAKSVQELMAKNPQKGIIFITAHLGSWEMAGQMAAKACGRPFYVLAKPSRYGWATLFLDYLRQKTGAYVLWTNKKSIARDMLKTLDKGEGLGFVMDQKPQGRIGHTVSFFDIPTEFVTGPAAMAIQKKVPIVTMFCLRVGERHYRLLSKTITDAGPDMPDALTLTQSMACAIEEAIRLYPEQWCWDYKRWRFSES